MNIDDEKEQTFGWLRDGDDFGDVPDWGLSDEDYAAYMSQQEQPPVDEDLEDAGDWESMLAAAQATPAPSIGEMLLAAKKQLTNKPQFLHEYLDGHPLGKFFKEVSDAKQIPPDSVTVIGLASLSAACCMSYRVKAHWGEYIPTGLYAAAEQPPSSLKSGTLRMFTSPIRASLKHINANRSKARQDKEMFISAIPKEDTQGKLAAKKELALMPKPIVGFISDATPEAIDSKALTPNGGFFNISSSEQTAANTVFGLTYGEGKAPNMAFLLEGYDAGWITGLRAGRDSFDGQVFGSCAIFAQPGLIDNILKVSNGTGMAERFMIVSEDSWLGFRDWTAPAPNSSSYIRAVSSLMNLIPASGGFEGLNEIEFNAEGMSYMQRYKAEIEPMLADGARYGSNEMRGFAGKADTMATKLAAVLHLVSHYSSFTERAPRIIHPAWVQMGIALSRALMENYFHTLTKKGKIGRNAEYDCIIDYLSDDKKGVPQIISAAKRTLRMRKVFDGNQKRVTEVLEAMVDANILVISGEGQLKKIGLNPRNGK